MFAARTSCDHSRYVAQSSEVAKWRAEPLRILLGIVLGAWLLGWVFHLGTGLVYVLLLGAAVVSVARLPWRQRERE
jgi:predicted MFS family arabinose efflux permease